MIYAEVTYQDEVNGDKTFKQKFYLQSFGGQWKIVNMKVVTSNKTEDTEPLKIAGEYLFENGDYTSKSATFEIISRTEYTFTIFVGDAGGCTGELEGTIEIKNNKATYSSEDCRSISFTFSANTVKIIENDCSDMHGASCNFSGTYKKAK